MSTQYRNLSDEDLVHRMSLKQDPEAFSVLFLRYRHIAMGICMKYSASEITAKEAVQNVFLKLWSDSKRYEITKFKSWFEKTLRDYYLTAQKNENTPATSDMSFLMEDMDTDDSLHLKLNEEQLLINLNLCLRTLSEIQQKCITHFYINQKSYKEISVLTGYSYNEVKSHIQCGRRNLKTCLIEKVNNLHI